MQAALLLLVVSFLCFGSWASLFKASHWRYELFYFDFIVGALALTALCAYTLGTLGSDMSFADRAVVAGTRSEALALGAGFTFGLGNLLLLAGVALGGMSIAFPCALSLAFLIPIAIHLDGGPLTASLAAAILYLVSFTCLLLAVIRRSPAVQKKGQIARPGEATPLKIIALCVLAGLLIGASEPIAELAFWGDLGLGAYAGALFFCLGMGGATLLFNIFFMNMGLVGGRVTLPSYKQGTGRQHLLGILAGLMWAGGLQTVLLAHSIPDALPGWTSWLLRGWVLLAIGLGWFVGKEGANAKASRWPLLIGTVAFTGAIAVVSATSVH